MQKSIGFLVLTEIPEAAVVTDSGGHVEEIPAQNMGYQRYNRHTDGRRTTRPVSMPKSYQLKLFYLFTPSIFLNGTRKLWESIVCQSVMHGM